MKKLFIFSILSLFLVSCKGHIETNGVVEEIEKGKNDCLYYLHPFSDNLNTTIYIKAECGKYNIGDTLKLTK